jgi:hypothetical protein
LKEETMDGRRHLLTFSNYRLCRDKLQRKIINIWKLRIFALMILYLYLKRLAWKRESITPRQKDT